ncbi:MAG TPA: hypothetical protein VFD18_03590 [Chthoniobacterales bacterium]|nr:hypothetical protein [Chthoniobacterales bacterium]
MIGVVAKEHEIEAVEEFFQLFKVPWEFYRHGGSYDVLLVSAAAAPEGAAAQLVLIYGSEVLSSDQVTGASRFATHQNAKLDWRGNQIPLYGQLLAFEATNRPTVCSTTALKIAAIEIEPRSPRIIRLGYDLFEEIAFLLRAGQPVENALAPTLDLHIELLRDLILASGVSLIEIPPVPAGYEFAVCLTHDIDFVGIRRHKFDHTMWGFLYRSTLGAARNFLRGKASLRRLIECWKAAVKLPFVYLGWARDFWMPFEWYLSVEKNLSPTYFFIPFKRRRGDKVNASHAERRACAYDITDIPDWVARLQAEGCEIGVHGIDAWHSIEKGREELNRVGSVARTRELGTRSHWLLRDGNTCSVLEQAGYSYDSTCGYNETPGYRNGTSQVFRPPGAQKLLELPMHIQDGALFYPKRLDMSEAEAWRHCEAFIAIAEKLGGVLTVLWHDRSPAPERFWSDFYVRLVDELKSRHAWFGAGAQVVTWFRERRGITFERGNDAEGNGRIRLCGRKRSIVPPLRVRIHSPADSAGAGNQKISDLAWDGLGKFDPRPVTGTANNNLVTQPAEFHAR